MSYSELIELYFHRSSALQWYWTIYVIVIGGLLAFSSLRRRPDLVTTILITILYAFFAYKNLSAIKDVTFERYAVLDAIKSYVPRGDAQEVELARRTIQPTLLPPEYPGVRNFHYTSDLVTIAAFWAMEWRRRRWSRDGRLAEAP